MKTFTKTVRRVDPEWLNVELGKRVRAARDAKGWTQAETAIAMGVSRVCIANWESGRHQSGFMLARVYDLALLFDVPVTKLLP